MDIKTILLLACRQAHETGPDGVPGEAEGYDNIGFLSQPHYFISGTNLVLVGEIEAGWIVVPRGTMPDELKDWGVDLDAEPITVPGFPGKLHQGFYEAWQSLRADVLSVLPVNATVYVAGHSKGAAMAPLAAWDLLCCGFAIADILLVAPPRCGDLAFQDKWNATFPGIVRWENEGDVVPSLPPYTYFAQYSPVGKVVYLLPDDSAANGYPPSYREKLFGSVLTGRFLLAHSIDAGSAYARALGA